MEIDCFFGVSWSWADGGGPRSANGAADRRAHAVALSVSEFSAGVDLLDSSDDTQQQFRSSLSQLNNGNFWPFKPKCW